MPANKEGELPVSWRGARRLSGAERDQILAKIRPELETQMEPTADGRASGSFHFAATYGTVVIDWFAVNNVLVGLTIEVTPEALA